MQEKWDTRLLIPITVIVLFLCGSACAEELPELEAHIALGNGPNNPSWIIDNPEEITRIQTLLEGLPKVPPKPLVYGTSFKPNEAATRLGLNPVYVTEGVLVVSYPDGFHIPMERKNIFRTQKDWKNLLS